MSTSTRQEDRNATSGPAPEEGRNIVLCCDGTANEFRRDNTNIVRLYQVLERDPSRQVACYHPGVGTMEAVGALTMTARKVTKLLGMAIGCGTAPATGSSCSASAVAPARCGRCSACCAITASRSPGTNPWCPTPSAA